MSRIRLAGLLLAFVAICLAVGASGSWVTVQSVATWYPTLAKPDWNPPAAVFGPVWTILYILMGVAGWLVWTVMAFRKVRTAAAVLLLPYLLWVTFAAALNITIWRLNQLP